MNVFHNIPERGIKNPVIAIGFFDGVHLGHQVILSKLKELAKQCSGETTVITLWPHPRFVLNKDPDKLRLLNTLDEKTILLQDFGIENLIILPFNKEFASLKGIEFIEQILVKKLNICSLLVGYNHRFGSDGISDLNILKNYGNNFGFEVVKADMLVKEEIEISSSQIRSALDSGDVDRATNSLGYYYFLSGEVMKGNQIGREMGFPTANIRINESHKLIPTQGVYAVKVIIDKAEFGGMMNIGYRPTVEEFNDGKRIEVHLFDFDQDIYHKNITVQFIRKTRDEQKFNGLEELKKQLEQDQLEIKKILFP